mmetsp:Transcript_7613/g.20801  ORF Transcript_7613/g.20801 Transcript_7613/m.20801 type:complete len:221 (-) Transcript_7613:2370-3032(-)
MAALGREAARTADHGGHRLARGRREASHEQRGRGAVQGARGRARGRRRAPRHFARARPALVDRRGVTGSGGDGGGAEHHPRRRVEAEGKRVVVRVALLLLLPRLVGGGGRARRRAGGVLRGATLKPRHLGAEEAARCLEKRLLPHSPVVCGRHALGGALQGRLHRREGRGGGGEGGLRLVRGRRQRGGAAVRGVGAGSRGADGVRRGWRVRAVCLGHRSC